MFRPSGGHRQVVHSEIELIQYAVHLAIFSERDNVLPHRHKTKKGTTQLSERIENFDIL